ncbi:hypothetical protein CONPUDRAFT_84488 [Coniophora puteana RWD-64-598 SS2]|uniref:Protein-S-isoprenylcysteine O-methyltransferase n=1 Tax=Coniophora puteana (strain RWD-64-598) TaxID=741705 RepID=A0A5M3MFM6_CONPW|nr:uncharacterized protein CONPUDRAFT_84488 [Coniophora puteana RWD-64-598 SS2]EIW77391.1 hypothetical protein CONPUDRAFT_84488 [Coniophora puteana RWD-64-598 SS2]
MYIAGINVPFDPSTDMDLPAYLTTTYILVHTFRGMAAMAKVAGSEGGKIRPDRMPATSLGKIVSPIHGLSYFIPQLAILVGVPLGGFRQPQWMQGWALPDWGLGEKERIGLRVAACVLSVVMAHGLVTKVTKALGSQWHAIGRRESVKVIKHGAYSVVRHPMYSSVMIQQVLYGVMFWSWVPVITLPITAAAFAIKMPIEEELIQQDASIADEYRRYKKEVPYRVFPFLW